MAGPSPRCWNQKRGHATCRDWRTWILRQRTRFWGAKSVHRSAHVGVRRRSFPLPKWTHCSLGDSSAHASAQGLFHHRHGSDQLFRLLGFPIAPMVSFSEGSLVANLKNWARRSTRKERIAAKQNVTMTDEVEQSQRTSIVSQPLAATAEEEKNRRKSLGAQKIATAAETEQSHRTFFVANNIMRLLPTDTARCMTRFINRCPP